MRDKLTILVALICATALVLVNPDLASAGKGGGGKKPPPSDDTISPGEILNLDFSDVTATTVTLTWTRTADDNYECASGPASSYEVRFLIGSTPIDESNWASATPTDQWRTLVPGTPCVGDDPPLLAEDPYKVEGLLPLTDYHFAIKAADEAGNSSPISSELSVTTLDDGWTIEVVDDGGASTSLVFDREGDKNPSISYKSGGMIHFAHFDGFDWVITDLGILGGKIDLAYESAGVPALSFLVKAAKKKDGQIVMYGLWNGVDFDPLEAVATGAAAASTSLAFDASGNASIVWSEETPQGEDLMFAIRSGSGWGAPEVIDGHAFVRDPDLAYDPAGNATVAYVASLSDSREIRFAVRSASVWGAPVTVENIPDPDTVRYPSLAFDGTDQPAIAYLHYDAAGPPFLGNQVRLAVRDADDGWPAIPEVITSRQEGGSTTSLAFDGLGNIYVAFAAVYDGGCEENGIEVAINDGSGWTFDLVTELPFCTNRVSLALDPNNFNLPAVAIKDDGNGVLKFARMNP
ncbi:MAG: fibronectin type III domain-containing protein [Planctomycetota bacterium]|nr:fibronectin type III domain-containing protein [Planctomycetota bacterium]